VDHDRALAVVKEIGMDYRYKAGQRVRFSPGFSRNAAAGTYEVVRQLPPADDGEHQYRIKNTNEQHERVAKESELQRA
jgi:hypothetical protein